jgi:hypothetical protein
MNTPHGERRQRQRAVADVGESPPPTEKFPTRGGRAGAGSDHWMAWQLSQS